MTFSSVPYNDKPSDSIKNFLPIILKISGVIILVIAVLFGVNYALNVYTPATKVDGNKWIPGYSAKAGKKDAKIQLIYFYDLQCSACKDNDPKLNDIVAKYGDKIGFVYRNYPLTEIHPYAEIAAKGAQGASRQGFEKYSEYKKQVFAVQSELSGGKIESAAKNAGLNVEEWNKERNSSIVSSEVKADLDFIKSVNLPNSTVPNVSGNKANGTPTNVILEDEKPVDWWSGSIEQATQELTINKYLNK